MKSIDPKWRAKDLNQGFNRLFSKLTEVLVGSRYCVIFQLTVYGRDVSISLYTLYSGLDEAPYLKCLKKYS